MNSFEALISGLVQCKPGMISSRSSAFLLFNGKGGNNLNTQASTGGWSIDRLRAELDWLVQENIESIERQTFLGVSAAELGKHKECLERIREVSGFLLAALKGIRHSQ